MRTFKLSGFLHTIERNVFYKLKFYFSLGLCLMLLVPMAGLRAEDKAPSKVEQPSDKKTDEAKDKHTPTKSDEDDETAGNLVSQQNTLYVDLAREVELSERERKNQGLLMGQDLQLLQTELVNKMKEMESLRKDLSKEMEKKEANNENLTYLVTLYESLNPTQAAELLKRLPLTVSLSMIRMMSPKKSGKILAAMEPKIAAEMSRRLIKAPMTEQPGGAK